MALATRLPLAGWSEPCTQMAVTNALARIRLTTSMLPPAFPSGGAAAGWVGAGAAVELVGERDADAKPETRPDEVSSAEGCGMLEFSDALWLITPAAKSRARHFISLSGRNRRPATACETGPQREVSGCERNRILCNLHEVYRRRGRRQGLLVSTSASALRLGNRLPD
jgi:hypothetical protein